MPKKVKHISLISENPDLESKWSIFLFYFILFIDCMQAIQLMAVYIIYRRVFPLHFRLTFQDFPHFILLWGVPPPVSFWLAPPKFYSTSPSLPPPGSKSWMSHWLSHSSSSF